MEVMGNVGGGSFHSITQLPRPVQRGEVTRERNVTCKRGQDTKRQQESQDPEGRKRGNPRIFKIVKKEILRKPKNLKLLTHGLQETHELGGLNVEVQKNHKHQGPKK